jgi:hypothetical protein
MTEKRCRKCGECKNVSEFHKSCYGDGLQPYCKECGNECSRTFYINNKEKIKEKNKIRYEANKEQIAEYHKIYYEANKEKVFAIHEKWVEDNPDKVKIISNRWAEKHYNEDTNFKIAHLIRCRLSRAYRKYLNEGVFTQSLKYPDIDYEAIITHLGPIPEGFHYGKPYDDVSYSIDHIVPLRSWDLTDPIQFRAATRKENCRWLLMRENYDRQWQDGYDIETHRTYLLEKK